MAFYMFDLSHFPEDIVEDHSKSEEDDDYPSILRSDLITLASGQRITFGIVVAMLCVLSLSGNVGTLYVNHKRNVRVFFRICLISLAFSDLITTVFLTIGYLAQFAAPSVQIWLLGGIMCGFIPFVTTGAILVSSMTLVGIALDRYFAVMKAVIGFWNPNKTFSVMYAVCIWGLSFGIASPVYSAYTICEVYVVSTDVVGVDGAGSKELVQVDLVAMCVSDKDSNAYYYIVVVAIIFVPTLVAFVWLNSIIANKLWIRRHSVVASSPLPSPSPSPAAPPATPTTSALSTVAGAFRKPVPEHQKQMEMIQKQQQQLYPHACHCQLGNKMCISPSMLTVPTSLTTTATAAGTKSPTSNPKSSASASASVVTSVIGGGGNSAKHISSREARHLRMFTIVLILMAVFIFFRLPAWIFLIMRMYGTYTRPVHWILHFSFGTLTLASCVLNPLLYTFLAETIQYAIFMKGKLCGLRRYFGNCCARTVTATTTRTRTRTSGCHSCWLWCDSSGRGGDDNDDQKMSQNQHQNANQNQHDNDNADNDNDNDSDSDSRSNDGAKSTSKKSDDDSKVYTIIPVLWEGGGHVAGKGLEVAANAWMPL